MLSINTKKSVKVFNYAASMAAVWTILLQFIPKGFDDNNLIYAIGEIQAYDSSLFKGNLYLGDGVVSPRFIVDKIFAFIMNLNGGSWGGAALIWIYLGAVIYAVAIANIAAKIDARRQVMVSILLMTIITYCHGIYKKTYLAGFPLAHIDTIGASMGIAFAILSISFIIGEKRNYKAAWIFAAVSIACHIHEGIYCCAIIFFCALADSMAQKKVLVKENMAVIVPLLTLIVVAAPTILTDHMDVSNKAFVYIYALHTIPFHIVPKVWGIDVILKALYIDVGLFLLALAAVKIPNYRKLLAYEACFLLGAWIIVIAAMHFFTIVKPLAFVALATASKFFKYVFLLALIRAVQAVFILRDKGSFASSYAILFFAFAASLYDLKQIAVLLIIMLIIMRVEERFMAGGTPFIITQFLPTADILVFCLLLSLNAPLHNATAPWVVNIATWSSEKLIVLLFLAAIIFSIALKKKFKGYAVLCYLLVVCMAIIPLRNKVVFYEKGVVSFTSSEKALRFSMGDELFDLAKRFRASTGVSDEFLADPFDPGIKYTGWFQVVSERNCFVVRKAVPSSKSTVDDWYNRYMQAKDFDKKGGHEIKQIMNFANIEYVLVKRTKYAELDKMKEYSVFLSSSNDSFRVYRLSKSQEA